MFKCSYCLFCKKRDSCAKQPSLEMPLRATTLIHDKKQSGERRQERSKKIKMTSKIEICKFNFSISWNQHVYFINLHKNAGNNIHNGHPKHHNPSNIPILTRLLNEEEEETIHHVVELLATILLVEISCSKGFKSS